MGQNLTIDADFPGGNIIVDRIDGDHVFVRQDLRDTAGDWFYWAFRLRGAAGRRVTFHFTAGDVLAARGPAMSRDGGQSWQWLGESCIRREAGQPVAFTHAFPAADAGDVLLAFCPLYTQRTLDTFLSGQGNAPSLKRSVFCRSREGRNVELLTHENPAAAFHLLVTARHHACETMASYCMDGILQAALADDETGRWMRGHMNLAVIPFMDTDGVEAGDQGKNRKPYDHNRDYGGGSASDCIYPEVRTLRQWAPGWLATGKPSIVLDLHCPWIRGGMNEEVYFVGLPNQEVWQRVLAFSSVLERRCAGPMRYRAGNNLPHGVGWNTLDGDAIGGRSCTKWACDLPGIHFAASLEVPYANAGGTDVTPDNARALGRDLAAALCDYLKAV